MCLEVQHVGVHLEKGHNFFLPKLAPAQAMNPRETALTAMFKICSNDTFTRTLYNYQVPAYYTSNILIKSWIKREKNDPRLKAIQITDLIAYVVVYIH